MENKHQTIFSTYVEDLNNEKLNEKEFLKSDDFSLLPKTEDFVPKMERYIQGVTLGSALTFVMMGAALISAPSLFKVGETTFENPQAPASADGMDAVAGQIVSQMEGLSSLMTGGMFLMGLIMAVAAVFKFKAYAETGGGASCINPDYIETLHKNLNGYDLNILKKMSQNDSYGNQLKEDIISYIHKNYTGEETNKLEITSGVESEKTLFNIITERTK